MAREVRGICSEVVSVQIIKTKLHSEGGKDKHGMKDTRGKDKSFQIFFSTVNRT